MNTHLTKIYPNPKLSRLLQLLSATLLLTALTLTLSNPALAAEHLPDGAYGKPGLQLSGFRTDITLDGTDSRGTDGAEFTSGNARILFPLSKRISIFANYRAENKLNILHKTRIGANLRFLQPMKPKNSSADINPDGPLKYPYLSISAGANSYESREDQENIYFGVAKLEIIYPWKAWLTISAGAKLDTDTSSSTVDNFFSSLSIYTAQYLAGEPYANPDGPVGYLSFRIAGGGSSEGFFGQLDFLFPLNGRVTIGGFVRGERVVFPYERIAILGAHFNLYPGIIR